MAFVSIKQCQIHFVVVVVVLLTVCRHDNVKPWRDYVAAQYDVMEYDRLVTSSSFGTQAWLRQVTLSQLGSFMWLPVLHRPPPIYPSIHPSIYDMKQGVSAVIPAVHV